MPLGCPERRSTGTPATPTDRAGTCHEQVESLMAVIRQHIKTQGDRIEAGEHVSGHSPGSRA